MEIFKIVAIVVGTAGFWKILEVLFQSFSDRRLKNAEARNIQAQAEKTILENWMQWSSTLEQRVKESHEHTKILEEIIDTLRSQIKELKSKVARMEKHNKELRAELTRLKETPDEGDQ